MSDETKPAQRSDGPPVATGAVRIGDVADRAQVSKATVSRTLNGDLTVRREFRERVLRAASDLGYRPNRLAQNLRRQRSAAIGVVVSDIANPHFSEMVRAVEDEAYSHGYRVLVCNTDEQPAKQRAYLRVLADERVLGVLLAPTDPSDPEVTALLDAGTAVVAFDLAVADPRADAVVGDNAQGVAMATRLLIDRGHRTIGFVGGRAGVGTEVDRRHGYEAEMAVAGLPVLVVEADFRIEGGRQAVDRMLAGGRAPTGLVVANNLMTLGALQAAHDRHVAIPDDLALVGVDDPIWAPYTRPALTTVAQPVREMAATAMELLLERVAGSERAPQRRVHAFSLTERESSGRPR